MTIGQWVVAAPLLAMLGGVLFLAYSGGGDGFLWGEGRGANKPLFTEDVRAVANMLSPAARDFVLSASAPDVILLDAPDSTVDEVRRARLLQRQDLTKLGYAVANYLRATGQTA